MGGRGGIYIYTHIHAHIYIYVHKKTAQSRCPRCRKKKPSHQKTGEGIMQADDFTEQEEDNGAHLRTSQNRDKTTARISRWWGVCGQIHDGLGL